MSGRGTLVHLSQNSKYYYDFFDHELHRIDERGHDEVYRPLGFKNYERKLLELFIKNPDKPLSREDIITTIKGHKTTESPMSVDNHIVALRKAVGDATSDFIETVSGFGYCYHGEGISEVEINHDIRSQPLRILSKRTGGSQRRSKVLHRDADINRLCGLLARGERAILLTGFGGIGKTTIAHVLFNKLKPSYDRVAWISYHGTLINSFLESMDMFENISDPDERWSAMSKFLRNDKAKKIFFIDNADRDENCDQNPERDIILQDLPEWEETTVIVTSRIESIPGFTECLIESLGSEESPDPCVDLFYCYFNPSELKKEPCLRQEYDAVRELVSRAGFHTYAIELLAHSARYEESLATYLDQIKRIGFQFPSLQIYTSRHQQQVTMAQQLRLLFNLGSRNSTERQILWDFSVLPEGLVLSKGEVQELLSYSQNDLLHLQQDSWILYRQKYGFYLHPLVREIVLFDLQDGKAPRGTAKRIVDLTIKKELIKSGDSQSTIFRRLNIAEQIAKYVLFDNDETEAFFYHRLGRAEFIFGRKRLASVEYLEKALEAYKRMGEICSLKYTSRMANALYHSGYVKSATAQYRDVAKDDLKSALDLWEQIETRSRNIAMAHDHLGYVLSDDPETYPLAKEHLSIAIDIS